MIFLQIETITVFCVRLPCSSNILFNLRFYKVHNISTTLEDNIEVLINKIET